jgi:hypothetical protein
MVATIDQSYSYYNVIGWNKNGKYESISKNLFEYDINETTYKYLLFLKFEAYSFYSIPDVNKLMASLDNLYDSIVSPFVILTPRKNAPVYTASEDEFVYSFSCKTRLFKRLLKKLQSEKASNSNELLFDLLEQHMLEETNESDIFIRQIPICEDYEGSNIKGDVIIPHRGDNRQLYRVLLSLEQVDGLSIYVGIDQDLTASLQQIIERFPRAKFYFFNPSPVGPYVIRNRLIKRSAQQIQFFHDSDDLSSRDRFEKISRHMNNTNSELCGSHELRLDYYTRKVQAIRFPKDAREALRTGPWFPLLHPSSAINKNSFYECGTLSEERIFGNDTKFLLNSYFILQQINNVDEFLYIKKKHPGSLTTAEKTKLGSPLRKELLHMWNTDFEYVKNGRLNLEDSSLVFCPSSFQVYVSRILRSPSKEE